MKLKLLNEDEDKFASIIDPEEYWDQDPNFIKTIRLLNKAGFRTISSCMGHAPGTQYEEVDEWMEPYLTFAGGHNHTIGKLLTDGGFVTHITDGTDRYSVELRRDVNWAGVLKYVRSRLKT
jgi:hypothetical protein